MENTKRTIKNEASLKMSTISFDKIVKEKIKNGILSFIDCKENIHMDIIPYCQYYREIATQDFCHKICRHYTPKQKKLIKIAYENKKE